MHTEPQHRLLVRGKRIHACLQTSSACLPRTGTPPRPPATAPFRPCLCGLRARAPGNVWAAGYLNLGSSAATQADGCLGLWWPGCRLLCTSNTPRLLAGGTTQIHCGVQVWRKCPHFDPLVHLRCGGWFVVFPATTWLARGQSILFFLLLTPERTDPISQLQEKKASRHGDPTVVSVETEPSTTFDFVSQDPSVRRRASSTSTSSSSMK